MGEVEVEIPQERSLPDPGVIPGDVSLHARMIDAPGLVVLLYGLQAQPNGFAVRLLVVGPELVRCMFPWEWEMTGWKAEADPGQHRSPLGGATVALACRLEATDAAVVAGQPVFTIHTSSGRRSFAQGWSTPLPPAGDVVCSVAIAGHNGQAVVSGAALRRAAASARRVGPAAASGEAGRP